MNGTEYNNQFTQEELATEVWKDVVGYEGLYKVSNLGRVKSLDRVVIKNTGVKQLYKGELRKPQKTNDGYFRIRLHKQNKYNDMYVHRLVAQSFIPNYNNLIEINHKNEIRSDNRVSNLEWCTRDYNCNYGKRIERIVKSNSIPITMYDKKGNKLKDFKSSVEASKYLGKLNACSAIRKCCKGKRKMAYGYIWKYKQ